MQYYILNAAGEPVPADLRTWARWVEVNDYHLADENIGGVRVSTIFLGFDPHVVPHLLSPESASPVLWETMVFGGPLDMRQHRCAGNREQAEAMHARMVEEVKAAQTIQETETVTTLPPACAGGYLENKNGRVCLRMADTIIANSDGTFNVTREWRPPGKEPWDANLYRKVV